jgi:thiol-disulfide isomerase/thioredoxin
MKKLLTVATTLAITATLSFATSAIDKKVLDYQKSAISQNPNFKLKDLKIVAKKELPNAKGWYGYIVNVSLEKDGKTLVLPDTVFSNGSIISRELVDMKNGADMSMYISIDFKNSYYADKNIIAGNKGAKNKLVIFSDPHCPACSRFVPFVIDLVENNPKDMVLYYYHYPLTTIHPLATIVSKASIVAKKNGIKDIDKKVYLEKLTKKDISEEDALKEFNKAFGTSISMKDVDAKWVKDELAHDVKLAKDLALSGTPTLFVNNKRDDTRDMLKELLVKNKK